MHIAITITLLSISISTGLAVLGWILKSLSDLKADHKGLASDMSSIKEDVRLIKEKLMLS